MIEIFEIPNNENYSTAQKFGLQADKLDRVFIEKENFELTGIGILGLSHGVVEIKEVFVKAGYPFNYFDLLARSLLFAIQNFNPIKVRVNKLDIYYKRFGFEEKDGVMEIMSNDINLKGSCGGR